MRLSPILLIRLAVAAMFIIHGVARIAYGGVVPFGSFLDAKGLPFGIGWAWTVTAIEIAGGTLLAIGRYPLVLCSYFIVQTALGIWLVHRASGWFVVGLGRNGMEYSVLLIVCLVAVMVGKR